MANNTTTKHLNQNNMRQTNNYVGIEEDLSLKTISIFFLVMIILLFITIFINI